MQRSKIESFETIENNTHLAGQTNRYEDGSPVVVNAHLDTQRAVLYQLDTRLDRKSVV